MTGFSIAQSLIKVFSYLPLIPSFWVIITWNSSHNASLNWPAGNVLEMARENSSWEPLQASVRTGLTKVIPFIPVNP
jgi:hypothetical protein